MSPNAAMAAIETLVATAWAAGPNTPVAYPNVDFTPPTSGNWLKVDFVWGVGAFVSKPKRHSVTGILQLAVFGIKGQGDGALDTDAESARAIVNGLRMASPNADVVFGECSGPVRQFEESWRSLIVSCPIRVYETAP